MTLSLLIFVGLQIYFLREMIKAGAQDYNSRVYQALEKSSSIVTDNELSSYYNAFSKFEENVKQNENSLTKTVMQSVVDSGSQRIIAFTKYIVQKKPTAVSVYPGDTLKYSKVYADEGVVKIKKDKNHNIPQQLSLNMENDLESSAYTLKEFARLNIEKKPITQRVNLAEIKKIVANELSQRGLHTDFRIAVLDQNKKVTAVSDAKFDSIKNNYHVILFKNNKQQPIYYLAASFPDKTITLLNNFWGGIVITIITMLIIVLIYTASIYYMNKQKMISEIKTDFINNMSHEFKTPIATINLATDALKNTMISSSSEKVNHYANLIKQENKRMSRQIEMILRMSKLERNELEFNKKKIDLQQLIEKCIESMKIVVEQRSGTIIADFKADYHWVNVDEFHLENAIINLLDNANKYSLEKPKITLHTHNENQQFILEIEDEGMGMETATQKKIFEKFYREETGNIHNVKGHGLGLAYVKKIIEQHNGEISVKSSKGKGSTFIVKLPLNN